MIATQCARLLALVTAVVACRPVSPPPVPPLEWQADVGPPPEATRVELEWDREEFFRQGEVSYGRVESFDGTTDPFEDILYDPVADRLLIPGLWSLSRWGDRVFAPRPMAGPTGMQHSQSELRDALGRHACEVIIAVYYAPRSTIVLCSELYVPHAEIDRSHADVLSRLELDTTTLEERSRHFMRLAPAWDAKSMLWHFLRTGVLVVPIGEPPRYLSQRFVAGRHPTVRIDPMGEVDVLSRRKWRSGTLTPDGEFVGVVGRRGREELIGLGADGTERFRVSAPFAGSVSAHANGTCTMHAEYRGATTIACYGHDGALTWQRRDDRTATDWLVDEDGWVYLALGSGEHKIIVAVTPQGDRAWGRRIPFAKRGLAPAGDDVCFVTDPPKPPDELVCIGPRHGAPLPSTNTPKAATQRP